MTDNLSTAHRRYIASLWVDLKAYPVHLRRRAFIDNATPMSKGGRGIYTDVEARILDTLLVAAGL